MSLLRNRFRVIRVLSEEGGFGRTYMAEDADKLNERCVIKQFAPKIQGTWAQKKAVELFQHEAKRLQELGEHPQIPTLIAYFEQDKNLYLVQQFIDGQNLSSELQARGKYSESEIQQLLLNLLPVLKFIHEHRVVHRDIKPQNIIRRKSDGQFSLIDFGSSKELTLKVQTKTGTSIGSHGYSPIEQFRDGAAYPASDLFSLGATCFHLLTGISPAQLWIENGYSWIADWRQYLSSQLTGELGLVLDKLLKKDIQQRYQSADEVIRDLTFHVPPSLPSAAMTLPTQLSFVPQQKVKLTNEIFAGTAILLLGLTGFLYWQFRPLKISFSSRLSQLNNTQAKSKSHLNKSLRIPLRNFSLANTLKGQNHAVLSVAISPDGKTLASNNDDSIKLWNLATGKEISTLKGHSDEVNVLAFSPDGKTLVSGSEDRTIKLWNPTTGKQIRTLKGHSDSVHTLAFSRDGKTLIDGSDDNTIKLWNLATGQEIRTLNGHSSWVRSVAVSPDGQILASGSWDKTIKLWNIATGKQILTIKGHTDKVYSVAISPDGKTLVSGSLDKTVKLWEMATGVRIRTFKDHVDGVTSVSMSPDGKTLVSGSLDQNIKLWSLATGLQIRTLKGHSDDVHAIAISPDGKTLSSGSEDNTIKIWRVSR